MTDELNLEEVVAIAPEELTEEHTAFLKEHAEELTDEQKIVFKDVLEVKKEEKEEEIVPEYRFVPKKKEDIKEEEELDEDEIDPEDKKTIGKVVDRELKAVKKQLSEQQQTTKTIQDQSEVDAFIVSRPEAKNYRTKMLTYMKAEHYNALPAHVIYNIVAGDDLEKIGAEKERQAIEKANSTQTKGSSARPTGSGGKDWSKATTEEIAAKKAEIYGQI